MSNKQCVIRLQKEYMKIQKEPVPNILCKPLPNNILEWHYCIYDIQDKTSPYYNGFYHGKLIFPSDYPYKPPSIMMITPSGRFQVNTRLCLSMSDFHPETWNPMWSVSSILTGLLSFMMEDKSTYGSISTSNEEKKVYAERSFDVNQKNKVFSSLFPEIIENYKNRVIQEEKKEEPVNTPKSEMSNWIYFMVLCTFCAIVFYYSW